MTGRWDCRINNFIHSPKEAEDFLDEIEVLCKKHGISISHEDGHGAFQLSSYNLANIEWLRSAHLDENYPSNKSETEK